MAAVTQVEDVLSVPLRGLPPQFVRDEDTNTAHDTIGIENQDGSDKLREGVQGQLSPDKDVLNVFTQEDVPPNGGYGWVCTACLFLINAHTWGVNSAWAIFLAYYLSESTFPNATRFQFALIGGLSIAQCCFVTPLVAICNGKLGTRISLLIGTVLVFAALLGASYATQIWHLFLSQGVCFGWGMGFLYIPATSVLPQWFSTKRSFAMGLASSGAGLGGLAYNLATNRAVETLGLPWAYRILAICSLSVNLICSLLLKDRNNAVKPSQKAFDYHEYGQIEVLLVIAWGFFTELGYIVLLYSLPNYATTIGLSHQQGSVVGAMLNLSLGIGRPIVGWISDRYGRINVATLFTFICGLLCVALWVPSKNFGSLIAFALTSGVCCGIFWNTVTPVTAEVVGMKRLPSAFGMICLVLTVPATFAEPIALKIVDASGYIGSQIFVGCMFFGGAASTLLLRCWKLHKVEQKAVVERSVDVHQNATRGRWLTPSRLVRRQRI